MTTQGNRAKADRRRRLDRRAGAFAATVLLLCAATGVSRDAVANDVAVRTATSAKAAAATVPEALAGVWQPDDADGREQCSAYKALAKQSRLTEDEIEYPPLVGSLVVGRRVIHVYSEYGEGNFYLVERSTSAGQGRWTFAARGYIDTSPDMAQPRAADDESFPVTLQVSLSGDRLVFVTRDDDAATNEQIPPETFRRCAAIDPRLYRGGEVIR